VSGGAGLFQVAAGVEGLDGPAGVVVFDVVVSPAQCLAVVRAGRPAVAVADPVVDLAAAGGSVAVPEPAGPIPGDNALGEVFGGR
jgi:hypothetical protein